jgi:hypothetical protein
MNQLPEPEPAVPEHIRESAQRYLADGSVPNWATALRKAKAIHAAAAVYLEAKIRLEAERIANGRAAGCGV